MRMKILKLDCDTLKIIDTYKTMAEAGRDVGCSSTSIRQACVWAHRGRKAKGYRWFAVDEMTGLNYYNCARNEYGENLSLEEVRKRLIKDKVVPERTGKIYIDEEKLYCNQVEIISMVDIKVRVVDVNGNTKEQIVKLELYDYQDIQKNTDIISDCVGRVEYSLDMTDYEIGRYLNGYTNINCHHQIISILEELDMTAEECKEIKILEVVDIKFKVESFEIISE